MLHSGDRRHAEFLRGADLLIHDSQYTAAEYPAKVGWGHSTVEYVLDMAIAAGVRRLALFHHDPTRTDDALDELLARSREYARTVGVSLEVIGASEGLEVEVSETLAAATEEHVPRAPR